MKKILLLLTGLLSFTLIYGQHTLVKNLNAPRIDDRIVKQQVEYKNPGRNGENVLWNFGKLQPVDEQYTLLYHYPPMAEGNILKMGKDSIPISELPNTLPLIGTEHNTSYFYRLRNDTLVMTGYQNPTVVMHYPKPVVVTSFPLEYGKKMSSVYTGEGLYCDRLPMFIKGSNHIKADAWGMMVLPGGDTIRNVIRTKSIQHITEWNKLQHPDSAVIQQDTLRMRIESFRWYVKGYRYPVFETIHTATVTDSVDSEYFTTAFFYPPQDHYYLEDDPENLAILFDGEGDSGEEEHNPGLVVNPGDAFSYNFYPNPVRELLTVEFYSSAPGSVEFALFDMQGVGIYSQVYDISQEGIYSKSIDMAAHPQGSYVLKIITGNQNISEVIIKK